MELEPERAMPADKIVNDGLRGRQERRVASHAVVLETFPPTLSQRHLALFPLVGEVAHGSRWEQEGEHATY